MPSCLRHGDREAVVHFQAYCHLGLHPIEHDYCQECYNRIASGGFHCSKCAKEGRGYKSRTFTITQTTFIGNQPTTLQEEVRE